MEILTKAKSIIVWAVIIAFSILIFTGYFLITGGNTNLHYKDHFEEFNEGWTVELPDATYENASLPIKVGTRKNQTAVFTNTLPEEISDCYGLLTRNYHQILTVSVDGDVLFTYPDEGWNSFGNIISDEWCIANITPDYAGKQIEVSFKNTTIFPFSAYFGDFYIGEDNALTAYVRQQGFPGVIMGVIICVIAGMLLAISFVYRKHTTQSTNTAMGVVFMAFGIWIINRSKMGLFPFHANYVYWASLGGLLLVAPFLFLYSYFRNQEFKRFALWGFRLCLIGDMVLFITSFFINYDVEIVAIFAYSLSFIALVINTYSLFLGGFGAPSKFKSPIEKLLDRTEFVSNMLFPLVVIIETTVHNEQLWTEFSDFFKLAATLYVITYMVFILWRTFLVVQDRTIVTKQLHESRMELMMAQIQPHFIFNTLSSIRTLVMVDPQVSYNMLYDFSNYLRANIDNVTNLNGINFSAEVSHIKSYVNIERVRFGDRLDMEYDIKCDNFIVPPLSIQPLVENAIKHGVCKRVEGGMVYLRSYETDTHNIVEVEDTGIGFNSESAGKVFSIYAGDTERIGLASDKVALNVMNETMESLTLLDKEGNPLEISKPELIYDLSGNGSEQHQSTGMVNIILRLKEISNAKIEIYSREDHGTKMTVYFPKKD